jgi:hypothetical protein
MSFGHQSGTNPTTSTKTASSSSHGSSWAKSTSHDYGTEVWKPQAGYLKDVYSNAAGMVDERAGVNEALRLHSQGANAVNMGLDPFYLNTARGVIDRTANPGVNPAFDAYANRIGEQFREQIMPALSSDAIAAGGLGGGRQGVAEGVAAGQLGRNLQDFGAELYNADQNRAMQAAGLGRDIFSEAAGFTPQLANLGMQIPWFNLQQYGGLIGGPTYKDLGGKTVSKSGSSQSGSSTETSTTTGGGGGGGWQFGL